MSLTELALVGTARHPQPPASDTPVDGLVGSLGELDAERRALLTAGLAAVYRRAGRRAGPAFERPQPALPDSQQSCTPRAETVLRDALRGGHLDLLPEFSARLQRRGLRLPAGLLVEMLSAAGAPQAPFLAPILGARGRWLVGQCDAWPWMARALEPEASPLDDLQRTWDEGRFEARAAALEAARRTDPGQARAWLAAAWASEKAEQRARFVSALASGLATDDEAWLEQALDDRSQLVRLSLARVLARLPGSAFAQRAAQRADAVLLACSVQAAKGLPGKLKTTLAGAPAPALEVRAPSGVDAAAERDGWIAKAPKGLGERAHWLAESLAHVPPSRWTERFGLAPPDLVRAAWAGEWGAAVSAGWSRAALLFEDAAWVPALWDGWMGASPQDLGGWAVVRRELLESLLARLSQADAQARVLALLGTPHDDAPPADNALARVAAPWDDAFGRRVLETLEAARDLAAGPLQQPLGALPGALLVAARALPLALAERAGSWPRLPESHPQCHVWQRAFDAFSEKVALRRRFHEEVPE